MKALGEYDYEPVAGLPEALPPGERILWQGAPDAGVFARRALHMRKFALYFAVLLGLRFAFLADTSGFGAALGGSISYALLALLTLVTLRVFAGLVARTTLYTLTNRRLVMRFGIALPMSVNLPFAAVESADAKTWRDGSGDLSVAVAREGRPGMFVMWPHVRLLHSRPCLRALADVQGTADVFRHAIAARQPLEQAGADVDLALAAN